MNFADFKKKLASDQEFAKKFVDVKSPAELIKLAAAEGYTFTEADLKNSTDVTSEELENAAGGGFVTNGSGDWVDFSTSIVKGRA